MVGVNRKTEGEFRLPVAAVCSAAVSPVTFFANRHVLAGATFVPRAVQVIIAVLFLHWAHWLSQILADFDVDEYKVGPSLCQYENLCKSGCKERLRKGENVYRPEFERGFET